jgi:hypothetical protein
MKITILDSTIDETPYVYRVPQFHIIFRMLSDLKFPDAESYYAVDT